MVYPVPSSYVKYFKRGTNFDAVLCTFSIAMISPLKNGPQITLPYSKCGRTSALYKSGNVLLSITAKDFFINPNTDFPFLMAIAVCL